MLERDAGGPRRIEWNRYPVRRVQFPGNEGFVLRINEAYEHEAILTRQGDECGSGCNKVVTQCVDVTAPVTLVPNACLGTVTVACQGVPTVNCVTDPCGTSSTITVTQRVCVTIPVRYDVSMNTGEPTISCADGGPCGPCSPCGCKG